MTSAQYQKAVSTLSRAQDAIADLDRRFAESTAAMYSGHRPTRSEIASLEHTVAAKDKLVRCTDELKRALQTMPRPV